MSIVVTGSSGFVGSAVMAALARAGLDGLGIDRRPPRSARPTLLADLLDGEPAVEHALRTAEAVVHLAARAGVRERVSERSRSRDTVQTCALVTSSVPAGVPLLVASSSSVYGGARGRASHEDDRLRPRGDYARSKAEVERLCARRAALGGAVTVLRPFTVIGEGQRADMALSRWARAARAGLPLPVLGSLERTRDVTDVRVLADAVVGLIERGASGTVNIGCGRPRSLGALVGAVGRALDLPVRVRLLPAPVQEPHDTHADTTRLGRLLGWVPDTDLDDAVGRAVAAGQPALTG